MLARGLMRSGVTGSALLAALLSLGACQDDAPAKVVTAAPGQTATWRIVVWGAGDDRDPRITDAIGRELLARNLAASIVHEPGPTDHVLQVTASPVVFPAQESIRDGRDSRLLEQASFHTDKPEPGLGAQTASDPTRALAVSIAMRIAQMPMFAPKPPPAPPAPAAHP